MYGTLLLLHLLGATIWTGGHLVLATTVLPRVLRTRSAQRLLEFESAYERIGMPALVVQIVTGLLLAQRLQPDVSRWLDMGDPMSRIIVWKLGLLGVTAAFALHARLRVIPRLTEERLVIMAWHIVPVTILSVAFVVAGLSVRTGWWPATP